VPPSLTPEKASPSWLIPAVLMLASTVGMLATDLYVPSLPTLTEVFATKPETIQLTMTLNLAGFAVGQLFFGPFSDRFGRRTAMLLGLCLFSVAALGCALAWSAQALIVARILLGLTGAAEAVIGMAVIKELYGEEKGVKIVAIYAMVIAAAPAVGPLLGGQMLVHFGWASNFWLLLGMALLTLVAVWRFLMETAPLDATALQPRRLLGRAGVLALHDWPGGIFGRYFRLDYGGAVRPNPTAGHSAGQFRLLPGHAGGGVLHHQPDRQPGCG
jgi:DHA1 family bicyclomycin/chloramphenicol resistance-like MFS transporter